MVQATTSPASTLDAGPVLSLFKIMRAAQRLSGADHHDVGSLRLVVALKELGPSRPSDIAAEVGLDLSTVSRQLRALERDGLVAREPEPGDRRAIRVAPTPRGVAALRDVLDRRTAVVAPVLDRWDPDDRATLTRLLDRLAGDMRSELTQDRGSGE